MDNTDTIAAVATGLGDSGIGIVRISGAQALSVADRIFRSKDGKKPSEYKTYTVHYGWAASGDETIEEVILSVMRSPRSYTREDVVEINCHGGLVAMRRVLDLCLENGCRLARPGEFTMRAFLNGRIDLAQAEAVADIICAKTDSAMRLAEDQLKGQLSRLVNLMRRQLLEVLSRFEATIDFPEEEIAEPELERSAHQLRRINDQLKDILGRSRQGRILREGIKAVICGRPNVGKSSLLNALLKEERCIVSPIAGTTRDTIEEIIDIRGLPVRIVDTAGIIEPGDLVEKKAVQRARDHINKADLVILVFDGSKRLCAQDKLLMKKLKKKTTIAVINKTDLEQKIEKEMILRDFRHCVAISAKRAGRIGQLEQVIMDTVCTGSLQPAQAQVSSLRHIEALRNAQKFIADSLLSLDNKLSAELVAQDIKDALSCLDSIVGKNFSGELLDKIFSNFCIGK